MSDLIAGTTIITIDWAVRGGLEPAQVEQFIDERLADLVEAAAELVNLDDPAQGMGMEADLANYRRQL